jgi:ribosomal protein L11
MNKTERRKTHQAINSLTSEQVAAIVKQNFPRVKRSRIDELAKAVIANAHRQVSPRLPRWTH